MTLHGTIVVLGVLFLVWKKPHRGIRLRLKGTSRVRHEPLPHTQPVPFRASPAARPQVLNVHFMYNGHSFDAYEVLGLPAGSALDRVEHAYQLQLAQPDGQAKEFLDTALKVLREHLKP